MRHDEVAAILDREEVRIRGLIQRLESGGVVGHSGTDEHLVPAEDRFPDDGAELAERTLELGLLNEIEAELASVDDARSRLADGSYGLCARCAEPIAAERLEALPMATHCILHA